MNRKNRKKALLLVFVVLVMLTFTACKGEEIKKDTVSINYNKRIESIEVINNSDEKIYATFNIMLLDKENEILVKEDFTDMIMSKGETFSVDLEDIKPEWLEYERVDSMDAEIIEVFIYGTFIDMLLVVVVIILFISFGGVTYLMVK